MRALTRRVGPAPWGAGLAVLEGCSLLLVAGLLLFSYVGASETTTVGTQLRWLSMGCIAVVVSVVVHGIWILAGLRAVRVRSRTITRTLEQHAAPAQQVAVVADAPRRVALRGAGLFHRPECQLVAGKPVVDLARAKRAARDGVPCGVCRPRAVA